MRAIAHGVCTDTTGQSALEAASGKTPLPHRGLEPASVLRLILQSDAVSTELSRPHYNQQANEGSLEWILPPRLLLPPTSPASHNLPLTFRVESFLQNVGGGGERGGGREGVSSLYLYLLSWFLSHTWMVSKPHVSKPYMSL